MDQNEKAAVQNDLKDAGDAVIKVIRALPITDEQNLMLLHDAVASILSARIRVSKIRPSS